MRFFNKTYCKGSWENYNKLCRIEGMFVYTKFLDRHIFPENSILYIVSGEPYGKYSIWYCDDYNKFNNLEDFRLLNNKTI